MTANYYECVLERKKKLQKEWFGATQMLTSVGAEPRILFLLVYCSTIFTTTLSYLEHKNCNIKGKSCPI
jgi:hypothetical protein